MLIPNEQVVNTSRRGVSQIIYYFAKSEFNEIIVYSTSVEE